jgi:hypothetical protein
VPVPESRAGRGDEVLHGERPDLGRELPVGRRVEAEQHHLVSGQRAAEVDPVRRLAADRPEV